MTHDNHLTTTYPDLLDGASDPALAQIVADLDTLAATGEPPAHVDAAIANALRQRSQQHATHNGAAVAATLSTRRPALSTSPATRIPRPASRSRQILEIAAACVAFALVTLALVAFFGSMGGGGSENSGPLGDGGAPPAILVDPSPYQDAILATLAPHTDDALLRHIVVDVEAIGDHDNAFDSWTSYVWQRWATDGSADEEVYIAYQGTVVAHIVFDAQQPLMEWEPANALDVFDVPREYSLQRRVFGATLAAALDPESYKLRAEQIGDRVVLHFQWTDHHSDASGSMNVAEMWFDEETRTPQRIEYFVAHQDVEPILVRVFIFTQVSQTPAAGAPQWRFELHGAWPPLDVTVFEPSPVPTSSPLPVMDRVQATWTAQAESDAAMWQQLRSRPFVMPTPAPDNSCGQSAELRLGQEPIYVQGEISHADTNRSYSAREGSDGFARYKVVWYGSPDYDGPALVRGRQIGGEHLIRFEFGPSNEWDSGELRLATEFRVPDGDWRTWHGDLAVPAAGCYAMHVDGFDFSYTIVIDVPE